MLTTLPQVKARLGLAETDLKDDTLLVRAIAAVSARFAAECRRQFARTVNFAQEFPAGEAEISAECFPVETVARFEVKRSEAEGWLARPDADWLLRERCVISLRAPLGSAREQARVLYTGGWVLPGEIPAEGQAALPAELEHAAVEQVAFWYQHRDRQGLLRVWDYHSTYRHFATGDLLESVRAVLARHARVA